MLIVMYMGGAVPADEPAGNVDVGLAVNPLFLEFLSVHRHIQQSPTPLPC